MASQELIESQDDWEWYIKGLDVAGKYNHRHNGAPKRFPCKVFSAWGDDPNGPYFYDHRFYYQVEKTCENCGHKHTEWEV